MTARVPLVLGSDGVPQQLQGSDSVSAALGYASGSTANGKWRQAPDGSIDQSGEVTLTAGVATITFPKAFPTSCDWVGLTPVTGSTTATDVSVYLTAEPGTSSAAIGGSVTQLGLNASIAAASFKVRWRATGI